MFSILGVGDDFSVRVYVSNILIQLASVFFLFKDQSKPYSLNKIFYLFTLFFFGVAPYLQFQSGSAFFGSRPIQEEEYFFMNVLILLMMLIYQFVYTLFLQKKKSHTMIRIIDGFTINDRMRKTQVLLLLALAALSFFMIFRANNFSLLSMLFRGGEFKESTVGSQASRLIIFRLFQPLSMMCLLYYISVKQKNSIILAMLALLTLITCFPLGMARFSAAALYLPLLLMIVPWFKKSNLFSITFILGILIVFPFLDNFRNFSGSSKIHLGLNFDMFNQGHFDCYQNFTLVVMGDLITFGRQLLGVFLFWIPRSVWPDKPIGSGAFIAETEGFYFSNVSCSYFAEGYINFGFLGILVFTILLAYITARLDRYYWDFVSRKKDNYFRVIYLLMIGMLFFILRGDLMSSFAYTIGFLTAIVLVYKVANLNIRYRLSSGKTDDTD